MASSIDDGVAEKRRDQRSALDALFLDTRKYRSSAAFQELVEFVGRFRTYSPYNAMLLHVQRPGAVYVATAERWLKEFGRRVLPSKSPLVILQPMGPVMFVFDVADTEPDGAGARLPIEVADPFAAVGSLGNRAVERAIDCLIDNAKRDGVRTLYSSDGAHAAGSIGRAVPGRFVERQFGQGTKVRVEQYPVEFDLVINGNHSRPTQFATLLHELAHLYCGHLGAPATDAWSDRRAHGLELKELEAECAAYLVCVRQGLDPGSHRYLSRYLTQADLELPPMSLEAVLRTAGLLESMGRTRLPKRKPKKG